MFNTKLPAALGILHGPVVWVKMLVEKQQALNPSCQGATEAHPREALGTVPGAQQVLNKRRRVFSFPSAWAGVQIWLHTLRHASR